MSVYDGKQPFTLNRICGAIADACLKDLRKNSFTFNGFPRIEAARNPNQIKYTKKQKFGFKVTLSINNDVSSSIDLTYQEAHDHVRRFLNEEAVDDQLFKLVQTALQSMEHDQWSTTTHEA